MYLTEIVNIDMKIIKIFSMKISNLYVFLL